MKTQVIVIHGGDSFKTYEEYLQFLRDYEVDLEYFHGGGWKTTLQEYLGESFDVISPRMPNKWFAKYVEWKIWFEKLIEVVDNDIILVGHSLGGIFLAKYLAENVITKNILGTFLVAAPFDDKDSEYSLLDFNFSTDMSQFEKQGGKIVIYQSRDDEVVPFVDIEKYRKAVPSATIKIFEDRGHFGQPEFPELVEDIKKLVN